MPALYKSLHGREFGITSTGGLAQYKDATGGESTAILLLSQMWGAGMVASHSSSEATLRNIGTNVISSATAAAYTFTVAAPVNNARTEIISQSSATTITLQSSATTILFATTGAVTTTGLTIARASTLGGCVGEYLVLRGLSATRWQLMQRSGSVTT